MLRSSRFAFFGLALFVTACGSVIAEPPTECGSTVPLPAPSLVLTDTRSATFVGEALHLETTVDGVPTYLVVRFDEDGHARAAANRPDLRGPANLAVRSGGSHARLRVDEEGAHADFLDTSDPLNPVLVNSSSVDALVQSATFTVTEERLFFCGRAAPDAKSEMMWVFPGQPGAPTIVPSFACNLYDDQRYVARGDIWLSWQIPTGFFLQDASVYRLSPDDTEHTLSYGYNQTGVHMYGNVVDATTNGIRAVFDPENESQFLLVDDLAGPYAGLAWAVLPLPGETHLLGLADTTLYLSTPTGARAYDITDIHAAELTSWEATIDWAGQRPKTLATSDRHLVVAAGDRLFLVPRDASGVVTPLVIFEDGEPLLDDCASPHP